MTPGSVESFLRIACTLRCLLSAYTQQQRPASIYRSSWSMAVEISGWTLNHSKHYGCKYWRCSTRGKMSRKPPEGMFAPAEVSQHWVLRGAAGCPEVSSHTHRPHAAQATLMSVTHFRPYLQGIRGLKAAVTTAPTLNCDRKCVSYNDICWAFWKTLIKASVLQQW